MKIKILTLLLFAGSFASANNLVISSGEVGGVPFVDLTAKTVTFTVTWSNSWYVAATPTNWDAVWVFVKWRLCSNPTASYTHGLIGSDIDDVKNKWTGLDAMSTPCTATVGGCGGADVEQSASLASTTLDILTGAGGTALGVMLRRSALGIGGAVVYDVSLNVTNLPAAGTDISLSVFGLEMVYVPRNNFDIGDAPLGTLGATNRFTDGTNFALGAGDLLSPYKTITSEVTGTMYVNAPPLLSGTQITGIPNAFPKGYFGFYIMKYEITEEEYVGFLNTLTTAEQTVRWMGLANFGVFRNQTTLVAGVASTNRADRAQNFLTYADVAAYLDWACLRPMTELEYEKAARGLETPPALSEISNGQTSVPVAFTQAPTTFSGAEDGTETVTAPAGCNVTAAITANFTNGDGLQGPVRVGIYATGVSTRITAGASYYGVMDLTGNVREITVAVASDAFGAAGGTSQTGATNLMTRTWGDGAVAAATGIHNVATWPASAVVTLAANTTNIIGQRGGDWATTVANVSRLQVSDRSQVYNATTVITNTNTVAGRTAANNMSGGRGVR